MEFLMDMVHHNPGEKAFETKFLEPSFLADLGYNAQVFKHINTAITFSDYDNSIFSDDIDGLAWIKNMSKKITTEILRAKESGLKVYYHIDLFVLPKALYNKYKDDICDEDGNISIYKEKTLGIHRSMFEEIFKRFPIDGLIIRVGETYLHDTPYHIGNGAVKYGVGADEQASFVKLMTFLREEVCEKHDKYLFFRTWDCYPDKFHADLDYYLAVTDKVEPHEKFVMSIKHTALDFFRRVKFNECLTKGNHRQIIEVQCQREYEGKGAYPSYVMNGVINYFEENTVKKGIRDIVNHPLICGVYTWSRGGGWYGPYPRNEFWCELNTYVIAKYASNPDRTEEDIFNEFATSVMGLSNSDVAIWRKLCLTANTAILKGKYVECYDAITKEALMPPEALWMRDDKIGGLRQMRPMFEYLYENNFLDVALEEKEEACRLWQEVSELFNRINIPDNELSTFIKTSIEYAELLYNIILHAWRVMVIGFVAEKTKSDELSELKSELTEYDSAWNNYKKLQDNKYSSTLYEDKFLWNMGLGETIDYFRQKTEM